MKILNSRFVKKVALFYLYVFAFLLTVWAIKYVLSGQPLRPSELVSSAFQPMNLYVLAFVTTMYLAFVAVVAALLKSAIGQKKR